MFEGTGRADSLSNPCERLPAWSLQQVFVMKSQLPPLLTVLCGLCVVALSSGSTHGDPGESQRTGRTAPDRRALNEIFGDRHIADNALAVHRRALKMPAVKRFEYLADWVLPNSNHHTIRTTLAFSPTHPAPVVDDEHPIDGEQSRQLAGSARSRVQTGGRPVGPAIDLIEVAKEQSRLPELRARIDRAITQSVSQRRSKLAMLVAIEMAQENFPEALAYLDRLNRLIDAGRDVEESDRFPGMLALWFAVRQRETCDAARSTLELMLPSQQRPTIEKQTAAWQRYLLACSGVIHYLETGSTERSFAGFNTVPPLKLWQPASLASARTRGQGFPPAHWQFSPARIKSLAGHDDDWLYFGIPLRGDFEVEGDLTGYGWNSGFVAIAGSWIQPARGGRNFWLGNLQGERRQGVIEPRLDELRGPLRYRAVIRGGVWTTYINSRRIHTSKLPADHDPWIAIRSSILEAGTVSNLRITGEPQIPTQLRLTALSDLAGWLPYYGSSVREENHWSQSGDIISGGTPNHDSDSTSSEQDARPPATTNGLMYDERLLQYHRPIFEDGSINYEFYYRPGEVHVHPALDRLTFVLDPSGVRLHWITDGIHDRTDLDPANVFDESENRRGPNQLPLEVDAWNRISLKVAGDLVHLSLNDQEIYERKIEVTNQRKFGIFHYADQTDARVRNFVWKGSWPRKLPSVTEQKLAGPGTDFLDKEAAELPDVLEHDFATKGLPTDLFQVADTDARGEVAPKSDGIHVTRPGGVDARRSYSIVPQRTIRGDFDIEASFIRFGAERPEPTVRAARYVQLSVALNDVNRTRIETVRHHAHHYGKPLHHVANGKITKVIDNQTRKANSSYTTFEGDSGTLRLARRGEQIYFLIAEHDSRYFRLLGEETVSDADVLPDGIQIRCEAFGPWSCQVIWTRVAIRADEIVDTAQENRDQTIADLKRQLTGDVPANALEFNGRNQYVTIPSLKYGGTHPITLEAFVTTDRPFGIVIGDTEKSGLDLVVSSSHYAMQTWNGRGYARARSLNAITLYQRVHLAGTFDGEFVQLFINGKLIRTIPLNGKFSASDLPMMIGGGPSRRRSVDYPFDGVIDEVRISNSTRYTKDFEVPTAFDNDESTITLYRFDEGDGQQLLDSSGNEHHGEIRGATWVNSSAIRHRAALGLTEFGSDAVEVLIESLKHKNADVRFEAAWALGQIGPAAERAIPALKQASKDKDPRVTAAAIQSLQRVNSTD